MANFYVSLSDYQISSQIADLLNMYNKLYIEHDSTSIIDSDASYFIEIRNKVVGCVGLIKEDSNISRLHHICTDANFRNQGIARKLIELAIKHSDTPYVYMSIRADNCVSLQMAINLGFVFIRLQPGNNHYLIIMGKQVA